MFFLIPLGVEGLALRRIPWASIALVALTLLGFWLTPLPPDGRGREAWRTWLAHPDLELPAAYRERFFRAEDERLYRRLHARPGPARDPARLEEEQGALELLASSELAAFDRSPLRRYALVPARGLGQVGLLTHLLLQVGWLRLFANLLFFYLVALLLEDAWGRLLFPAFYVGSGVLAGAAYVLADPRSTEAIVGTSGAVAACMGAFAIRFIGARVRLGYVVLGRRHAWRGELRTPAWLFALAWLGLEAASFFVAGASSGGATAAATAHMEGFLFGAAFALALRVSGFEQRVLEPALDGASGGYARDPRLDRAELALSTGHPQDARRLLVALVRERPDCAEGHVALVRLDAKSGDARAAMARLEVLLAGLDAPRIWPIVDELGPIVDAERFHPGNALRVARALEEAPEGLRPLAEPFYARAAALGDADGAEALVRAAELRLGASRSPDVALEYLRRAKGPRMALSPEWAERARRAEERARPPALEVPAASVEPAEDSPAPAGPLAAARLESLLGRPPEILACRLVAMSASGLTLQAPGGERKVDFGALLALAVAEAGEPRALFADLVVSPGGEARGPTVLRVPGDALDLATLYPGLDAPEALAVFVKTVLERSGAAALPDAEALREGRFPRFDTVGQMDASLYRA